ncbi:MAG: hypothetical protein LDLANPLL_01176 [Turneriella sp.]|nr:hypothetical protein [Turneriella sp.]
MVTISILASIAAFLHLVFFLFESVLWTKPVVRKIFGQTEADAHTTKLLALNQGFYNLFLALSTVAGILLWHTGSIPAAVGILTVSLASMVGAAVVLFFSGGVKMLRGALIQGLVPAVCLILLWRPA